MNDARRLLIVESFASAYTNAVEAQRRMWRTVLALANSSERASALSQLSDGERNAIGWVCQSAISEGAESEDQLAAASSILATLDALDLPWQAVPS